MAQTQEQKVTDDGAQQAFLKEYLRLHSSNRDAIGIISVQSANPKLCEMAADYILGNFPTYEEAVFVLRTFYNVPSLRTKAGKLILKQYPNERTLIEMEKAGRLVKIDMTGHSESAMWVVKLVPELFEDAWNRLVEFGIEDAALESFMEIGNSMPEACQPKNVRELVDRSFTLYFTKHNKDKKTLLMFVWKQTRWASAAAANILEDNPTIDELTFLALHAKNIGYRLALKAGKMALQEYEGLLGKLRGTFESKRACRSAIIRGYMDFVSKDGEVLSEEEARTYRQLAERAAELLLSRKSVQTETIIQIMKCLPSMRKKGIEAIGRWLGELEMRFVLRKFRLYDLVEQKGDMEVKRYRYEQVVRIQTIMSGVYKQRRKVTFEPEPDVSKMAAEWLLENAKEKKAFQLIADYVPDLEDEALDKIEELKKEEQKKGGAQAPSPPLFQGKKRLTTAEESG